ncbi:hypothetical protein [Streptomyces sp. NPDC055400]
MPGLSLSARGVEVAALALFVGENGPQDVAVGVLVDNVEDQSV